MKENSVDFTYFSKEQDSFVLHSQRDLDVNEVRVDAVTIPLKVIAITLVTFTLTYISLLLFSHIMLQMHN